MERGYERRKVDNTAQGIDYWLEIGRDRLLDAVLGKKPLEIRDGIETNFYHLPVGMLALSTKTIHYHT